MARLLLVDDQRLMTDGLKTILQSRDDLDVAGIAQNGHQALAFLEKQPAPVDLVLLDIRMPDLDGVQTVRLIKERWPQTKVLMLTTFNDDTYLLDALAGGADGYLLKDMETAELFTAIDQTLAGNMVMPGLVAETLRNSIAGIKSQQKATTTLKEKGFNAREVEIAALLADGYSNSQIAAALYLSEGTVRNYISSIYEKLSVNDRPGALLALLKLL
jgi:DNA-binding NarL/FixJ family response regulator